MKPLTKNLGLWGGLMIANSCIYVFPLMVLFANNRHASGEESLTLANDTCSMYDSCNVSDFFRTCSCDDDCNLYGTCCYDAPSYDSVNSGTGFHCLGDKLIQPVFFRKHCHEDFQGNPKVKRSCESADTRISDLMERVPVSSRQTHVTYWNWNCAMCNQEKESDLSFWTVQASCSIPKASRRFDVDVYRMNMAYDESTNAWGIYDDQKFKACPIAFFQPPFLTGRLKYCAANMVSDCPTSWKDEEVRTKCATIHGERKRKGTSVYYKNAHCANCNGVPTSELECFGRTYKTYPPVGDSNTMKIIFNLNADKGEHSRDKLFCFKGENYDPFLKKCRFMQCGIAEDNKRNVCQYSSSAIILPSVVGLTLAMMTTVVGSSLVR